MRVHLDIPFGDRQQEFLDYLGASLRKELLFAGSSAHFTGDGLFQSSLMGLFRRADGHVSLEWKLVQNIQKTLLYLEVLPADERTVTTQWESSAQDLVLTALASAVAERKRQFFRRNVFSYLGCELDGEYWLSGMRIAPMPVGEEHPATIDTERMITIDLNVDAADDSHASILAHERARREGARLGLLLNIGLTEPDRLVRWGYDTSITPPPTTSIRFRSGLFHSQLHATAMPGKEELCPLGKYAGRLFDEYSYAGELLSLPSETRRIFKAIAQSGPEVSAAFDRCAQLYQVAEVSGRVFPTVGLAYRVASIEAAATTISLSKLHPLDGFRTFMRRHAPAGPDRDRLIELLYGSIRSAHFHAGSFPLGDFSRTPGAFGNFMSISEFESQDTALRCHELTRQAIAGWLATLANDHEDTLDKS